VLEMVEGKESDVEALSPADFRDHPRADHCRTYSLTPPGATALAGVKRSRTECPRFFHHPPPPTDRSRLLGVPPCSGAIALATLPSGPPALPKALVRIQPKKCCGAAAKATPAVSLLLASLGGPTPATGPCPGSHLAPWWTAGSTSPGVVRPLAAANRRRRLMPRATSFGRAAAAHSRGAAG